MKKNLLGLATIASMFVASFAFAATSAPNSGYYSPAISTALTTASVLALPTTNITVLNYTEERIFVAVPGVFEYEVVAGNSRTIARDSYYGDTNIMLSDWVHNPIKFNGFPSTVMPMCRRAILTLDGRPGNYHLNVDKQFC